MQAIYRYTNTLHYDIEVIHKSESIEVKMATTDSKKKSKYEMTLNREDVAEKSSFEEIGKEDSFVIDPIQGIFSLCSTHDEKVPFHMSRI